MDQKKLYFITAQLIPLVKNLRADTTGKWGKMNAQQMIEHVSGFFKVSTKQLYFPLVTPDDVLPKVKAFLYSDKEFRENTKAPVLPEDPLPTEFDTIDEAIIQLEKEIHLFVTKFTNGEIISSQHPVFGELNYEEWVLLHYKHVLHHAKQFELI